MVGLWGVLAHWKNGVFKIHIIVVEINGPGTMLDAMVIDFVKKNTLLTILPTHTIYIRNNLKPNCYAVIKGRRGVYWSPHSGKMHLVSSLSLSKWLCMGNMCLNSVWSEEDKHRCTLYMCAHIFTLGILTLRVKFSLHTWRVKEQKRTCSM